MKIITTENASATQTEHPTRATLRTFLQAAVLAFPILLALPEILTIIDDELGTYISDDARGWLALIAGIIAAGAAALARIMAVPAIERALRGIGLGAAPSEPNFGHWDGEPDDADTDDLATDEYDPADAADQNTAGLTDVTEDDELATTEVDLTPPPPGYEPRH